MNNQYQAFVRSMCRISASICFLLVAAQTANAFDYPEKGDSAKGATVWSENCARCHNMRSASDLRDDQWITTVFHMRIRAGLTGQESRDVLTFLQASNARGASLAEKAFTSRNTEQTNRSGQEIYENNCMACHGADGSGGLPGVPDFTDEKGRLAKDDGELLNHIIFGFQSPGSLMPMPPRGGNPQLSDSELSKALQYIKSKFKE